MSIDRNLQERVQREAEAHSDGDVLKASYELKDRFSHIWSYPSRVRMSAEIETTIQDMSGKTVLDYGCGRGESSLKYLAHGALVYGIDISPIYVAEATRIAEEAGYSSGEFEFSVMDGHALEFDSNTFDLVIGEGILHHLDANVALQEIRRVLKPGGRVLLLEPLAGNPLLRLFRWLTPAARTEDESPFTGPDLSRMLKNDLWNSEATYCGVIEAPVAVLTSMLIPRHPDNALLRLSDRLERWLHGRRLLLSWNQYILFNLVKI